MIDLAHYSDLIENRYLPEFIYDFTPLGITVIVSIALGKSSYKV
jgi:hypothetical protein